VKCTSHSLAVYVNDFILRSACFSSKNHWDHKIIKNLLHINKNKNVFLLAFLPKTFHIGRSIVGLAFHSLLVHSQFGLYLFLGTISCLFVFTSHDRWPVTVETAVPEVSRQCPYLSLGHCHNMPVKVMAQLAHAASVLLRTSYIIKMEQFTSMDLGIILALDLTRPHWALGPLVVQLHVLLFIPPVLQLTHNLSVLRLLLLKAHRFLQSPNSHPTATWLPTHPPIIKHIPKSVRPACASHLLHLLGNVVSNSGDVHHWLAILNWTRLVLANPKRGGKRHNVASTVKKRLTSLPESSTAQWPASLDDCVPISTRHSKSSLSDTIAAKMKDGNVRAAVKLQLKHPKAPADWSASLHYPWMKLKFCRPFAPFQLGLLVDQMVFTLNICWIWSAVKSLVPISWRLSRHSPISSCKENVI